MELIIDYPITASPLLNTLRKGLIFRWHRNIIGCIVYSSIGGGKNRLKGNIFQGFWVYCVKRNVVHEEDSTLLLDTDKLQRFICLLRAGVEPLFWVKRVDRRLAELQPLAGRNPMLDRKVIR
jgi:hypothetical protein